MEDRPENYPFVTFELRPAADGTEVVLTQANQTRPSRSTEENRKEYAKTGRCVEPEEGRGKRSILIETQ